MSPAAPRTALLTLPNLLSLSRLPLGGVFWVALGPGAPRPTPARAAAALGVMGVAALTDVLDGYIARRRGADLAGAGSWLDPVCDKLFVGAVLASLHVERGVPLGTLALIVTRELLQLPMVLVYRVFPTLRHWLQYDFRASPLGKAATCAQFLAIAALVLGLPAGALAVLAFVLGTAALGDYIRRAIQIGRERLGSAAGPPLHTAPEPRHEAPTMIQEHPRRLAATGRLFVIAIAGLGCQHAATVAPPAPVSPAVVSPAARPLVGSVERLDPALDAMVDPAARVEVLAEGYKWSEGPVWTGGALLFSDVPNNVVWRWTDATGAAELLRPSGYTGSVPRGGEPGSNGLAVDAAGRLYLCQHGDRRIARWEPTARAFLTVADRFEGKRFNSPNDLVVRPNGDVYFTDPIYGLVGHGTDPAREIPWSGVYRSSASGEVTVLDKALTYPNGLAFSPDGKTLYVSQSDPDQALWMAYDLNADGAVAHRRVFFDATALAKAGKKGLPDGLKVDDAGNLFATGPGGVLVFSPLGKHLGTIVTGEPTANCAFGDDGSTLYMTANNKLTRIRLRTRGPVGK